MDTSERAKELRNAYQREWRAKNRDKVRVKNERYWLKKAAEAERKEADQTHADN